MDLSYNAVAAKCADQMARYQDCVLKNQDGDWSNICRPQGKDLAACADAAVPHLAELKNTCAAQISSYRQCLEKNAEAPEMVIQAQCGNLMKELWECTEKAIDKIEKRDGVNLRTGEGGGEGIGRIV